MTPPRVLRCPAGLSEADLLPDATLILLPSGEYVVHETRALDHSDVIGWVAAGRLVDITPASPTPLPSRADAPPAPPPSPARRVRRPRGGLRLMR